MTKSHKKTSKKVKTKNKKLKILLITAIIIGLLLILTIVFVPHLEVKDSNVTINYKSEYKDSGYVAKSLVHNYHKDVTISGKVDPTKLGTYKVKYNLKFLFLNITRTKTITVADTEKPTITLNGEPESSVCPGKTYEEQGYTVTDNVDTDLQDKVQIKVGENEVQYTVRDKAGNTGKITRKLTYQDKDAPIIELKGANPSTIYIGSTYNEEGFTTTDGCDGDLTSNTTVTNNIDQNTPGTYEVTYTAKDSAGNVATVTRTIKVVRRPSASEGGNGVIYLTFDDGPSSTITSSILDILSSEGIKATFFVTHKPSLDYLLKREHAEGHTVALHTATHNYASVYSSVDNYFNDLYTIQSHVRDVTGVNSTIIRFPGGSSNTISRNYCKGIMTALTSSVESKGFKYFDWNVDSCDAGGAQNQTQVYNNVTSNLSHSKTNVVLMHDFENNYKTLNALRSIIQYGKNNGYTFSNITMDTPNVHHGVNN